MEDETVSHTRNVHALQDTIARIMDLNKEIEADTDALVDLREEALHVIQRLDDASCQTVLTLRYVWLKPWDAVAAALAYNLRSVYKVRDRAIAKLDGIRARIFFYAVFIVIKTKKGRYTPKVGRTPIVRPSPSEECNSNSAAEKNMKK